MILKKLLYIPQHLYYIFVEKSMLCNMSITSHSRDLSTFLLVDNDYHVINSLQVNYFFSIEIELLSTTINIQHQLQATYQSSTSTTTQATIHNHNQYTYNYKQPKLIIYLQYYIYYMQYK